MIRKTLISLSCALLFVALAELPLSAEFIFLKTGEIIEGSIIVDGANSITIRTIDKKNQKILRNDILRILYTKLNMGKIYIQKRDGKGMEAYIVDEDQDSYTFRSVLNNPEEFTIKRSAILFIADKNPSGLEGEAGTESISLKWLPPYNKVKQYNIYIKSSVKEKFMPADTTGGQTLTIKKLKSNTTYWFIVTAADSDNYESMPSNELMIATKNIKPDTPKIISSIRDFSPDKTTTILKINWAESHDNDGRVVKYRIYCTRDKKRVMTGELTNREFVLTDAKAYDRIELVSVDDRGDESESAFLSYGDEMHLFFSPGILIPMSKFGKLSRTGFGGAVGFTHQDMFIDNLEGGVKAGFYYLSGKDKIGTNIIKTERIYFVPITMHAGYRFRLSESMSVIPYLAAGAAYMDMPYTKNIESLPEKRHLKTFGPIAGAGISFKYATSDSFYFGLSAEYATLISKKITDYPFIRLEASAGYKL
jgi:hypothetical protein